LVQGAGGGKKRETTYEYIANRTVKYATQETGGEKRGQKHGKEREQLTIARNAEWGGGSVSKKQGREAAPERYCHRLEKWGG